MALLLGQSNVNPIWLHRPTADPIVQCTLGLVWLSRFYIFVYLYNIRTPLTLGGNNDTDIATPTNEASFPDSNEMATAQPDGKATNVPTHTTRSRPRSRIMYVGHSVSVPQCFVKFNAIIPNR